jgi:hypothetical protein
MPYGEAPLRTARTETQATETSAPRDLASHALGAPGAPSSMDYGAPVGREVQVRSAIQSSLGEYAKLVAEAVARGDFEHARELIDEAVRIGPGGNKT